MRILGAEIGNILGTVFGTPLLAFAIYYVTPVIPLLNLLSPLSWQAFAVATSIHWLVTALMWVAPERLELQNEVTTADRAVLSVGAVVWTLVSVWLYAVR